MNKEIILETNDEAVDLSRRSMMGRLGLMASLACAAPVLMTVSTSTLANHKNSAGNDNSKNVGNNGRGWGCDGNANGAGEGSDCDGGEGGGDDGGGIDMGL